MSINPIRHIQVFQPVDFDMTQVDIIGVGAVGSKIALEVAKLGVRNIHLWDFDNVEEHNLANQMYGPEHIGKPKVEACAGVILRDTGTRATQHNTKILSGMRPPMGDVVFLQTDTMESRKFIWEESLRINFRTRLMIESRMGTYSGRVYTVDPNDPIHVKGWEETLYTDEESLPSECGTKTTVGATGDLITGFAVWQFILWTQANLQGKEVELQNEILFSVNTPVSISRRF